MRRIGALILLTLGVAPFGCTVSEEREEREPVAASGASSAPSASRTATGRWIRKAYPAPGRVREARQFAASRSGTVSFAVIDAKGGVRGLDARRQFSSASASKALLLAAELRRLRREGDRLDSGTRSLLRSMITVSDNDAAGEIYSRVGDDGLRTVARKARMRDFEVTPGYWGGAQITAADMVRFYFRLNRNLVGPHRRFGKHLLAGVVSSQRWGIAEAAGKRWRIWFKGGWRPPETAETSGPVTHQAGLLVHRSGRRIAIAVLTDQAPGGSSFGAIEGIASRLLHPAPRGHGRWPIG